METASPTPPDNWPAWKVAVWGLLTLGMVTWTAPTIAHELRPDLTTERAFLNDFFQDWASARLAREGRPVYGSQRAAVKDYLGLEAKKRHPKDTFNEVNAHPPSSILVALPFSWLGYPDACVAWGVFGIVCLGASVALILGQLKMTPSPWALLPALTLGLCCAPLREQIAYGQFNLLLLLLVTGAWAAARSQRPWLAGLCLGAAAVIKLFPAFLFLYFLARRDFRTVLSGCLSVGGFTLLTLAALGGDSYRDYFEEVLPHASRYYPSVANASSNGYFSRLFSLTPEDGTPLTYSPAAARVLVACCSLGVCVLIGYRAYRADTVAARDQAFGLGLTGLMLVSPLTWLHYGVLLLLPCVLLWRDLPGRWLRGAFYAALAVLWLPELFYWHLFFGLDKDTWWLYRPNPWQSLTLLSLYFYAFLCLFVLNALVFRSPPAASRHGAADPEIRDTQAVSSLARNPSSLPECHRPAE